jgi:tetratricopeptide (TPR) repeat protein
VTRVLLAALAFVVACTPRYVQEERRQLGEEMPATLEARTKFEGTVRTAKVRVYADTDYRAQNIRWKKGFGDQLDYANQLLEPMLGLRLEAEYKEWDRRAPETPLRETVRELAELDPGDDVAWVFGLTASTPLLSQTTDELGVAEVLGSHIVLRGYSDLAERKAFARAFPDLSAAERDEVHDARRRHKQTVVLVHELAHTLGALHETDPDWIMAATYSPKQASFGDRNRELMLIGLADRLRPKELRNPVDTAEKLVTAIESADWGGWVQTDKEEMLTELKARIELAAQGKTAAPVPSAAVAQFTRAQQLAGGRKFEEALAELDPLIAAYPGNAAIRLLACQIHLAKSGPKDATANEVCGRAADLAPGDPSPYLAIAATLAQGGDLKGARAKLVEAEGRIANLQTGQEQAWLQIASMYQALGSMTWAEDAAAKAGDDGAPIIAWAKGLRARYGVPRDGKKYKITPESEGELVLAVRGVLDLVYANKLAEAAQAARKAEKRWPNAPGLLAARCDLALRKNSVGQAKQLCAKAIAEYEGAAWAHYLMGIIVMRNPRNTDQGIVSLRAAIAADPDLGQAWRALGKALARQKDKAALDEVRAQYRAKFGTPLPE